MALNISKRVCIKKYFKKRHYEPRTFLRYYFRHIHYQLNSCLDKLGALKFQLCLSVKFKKINAEGEEFLSYPHFSTEMKNIFIYKKIKRNILEGFEEIVHRLDTYISHGSGWLLENIICLTLTIIKIKNFLKIGCLNRKDKTDLSFLKKGSVLKIRCPEGKCLAYSIASFLVREKIKKNPHHEKHYSLIVKHLKGFRPYMKIKEIPRFEILNNLRINIFIYDKDLKKVSPIYLTSRKKGKVCHLLMYKNHYFPIRNWSTLLRKKRKDTTRKKHICKKCFFDYKSIEALQNHNKLCGKDNINNFKIPNKGTFMYFKNYNNLIRSPFVIYIDFECLLKDFKKEKKVKKLY